MDAGKPRDPRDHLNADGEKVKIDILMHLVRDEEGSISHAVEIMRDVSALVEAEASPRQYTHIFANITDMPALNTKRKSLDPSSPAESARNVTPRIQDPPPRAIPAS